MSLPGFRQVGRYTWLREERSANPLVGLEEPLLLAGFQGERSLERLLFLDTETTGLSGGAGNVIFLVGFGRIQGDELLFRQIFLSDFPGEPELIAAIARELEPDSRLVTYNGRGFDLPVMRTRFLMHRRPFPAVEHLDLLTPTRRLWKGLIGSCSLHAIEERVLGVERDLDVPGFLVPDLYFQFLRSSDPAPLLPVFAHHRQDVLSLARLLAYIERSAAAVRAEGGFARRGRFDRVAMGRLLLDHGREEGLAFLERCSGEGDFQAGREASLIHKRRGNWDRAVAIWSRQWEGSRSRFAGIELAKYYEHRSRDPERALAIVEELCRRSEGGLSLDAEERASLLARQARLERGVRRGSKRP